MWFFYEDCFPYASPSASQSFPSFPVHSYDHGKDLVCSSPFSHSNILDDSQSNMSIDHSQLDSSNTSSNPLNSPIIVPPRRSNRDRTRPKKFQDFHTTFTSAVTGQSSSIRYPLASILYLTRICLLHTTILLWLYPLRQNLSHLKKLLNQTNGLKQWMLKLRL